MYDILGAPDQDLLFDLVTDLRQLHRTSRAPKRKPDGSLPPILARIEKQLKELFLQMCGPDPLVQVTTTGPGQGREYTLQISLPQTQVRDWTLHDEPGMNAIGALIDIVLAVKRWQILMRMPLAWRRDPRIAQGRGWNPLSPLAKQPIGQSKDPAFVLTGHPRHSWSVGQVTTIILPMVMAETVLASLPGKKLAEVIDIDLGEMPFDRRNAWHSLTIDHADISKGNVEHTRLTLCPQREVPEGDGPPTDAPAEVQQLWRDLEHLMAFR